VNKSIEGGDEQTFNLVEGHKKFNETLFRDLPNYFGWQKNGSWWIKKYYILNHPPKSIFFYHNVLLLYYIVNYHYGLDLHSNTQTFEFKHWISLEVSLVEDDHCGTFDFSFSFVNTFINLVIILTMYIWVSLMI
jgi:hypothetical protein